MLANPLVAQSNHTVSDSNVVEHLRQLVHRPSVTPSDAGCQQYLNRVLSKLGFDIDMFEVNGVSNFIAKKGSGPIRIAFAGHTDVVPALKPEQWRYEPFVLTEHDGNLYGRGVADMKGGVAAMLAALDRVDSDLDYERFTFYILITSDEEGEAEFGSKEIVARLEKQRALPHLCIVGEPSSSERTGDVVKIGRRGAISGEITIKGKQGHVAYPKNANNASHKAMALGKWLTELSWDEGSTDFPGSHLQITGLDTGIWTDNIIPGECRINFNIRYSHKQTEQAIKQRISDGLMQLKQLTSDLSIEWSRSCHPYYTSGELVKDKVSGEPRLYWPTDKDEIDLVSEVEQAIFDVTQRFPRLSTSGGTSDGRFFAAAGAQVIELGLPNHSIHQVDEHVHVTDLVLLQDLFGHLLLRLSRKC